MEYEYAQRRRLFVALALTVVLVPAAFLLNRGGDDDATAPTVTLVGGGSPVTVVGADARATTAPDPTGPAGVDVMGTAPIDALDPDSAPPDDPATIAIPRVPRSVDLVATFSRDVSKPSDCYAPGVTFQARITVTNLDNSQSVDCINNMSSRLSDELILHPDAFLQIADLSEAPVPVQVTW